MSNPKLLPRAMGTSTAGHVANFKLSPKAEALYKDLEQEPITTVFNQASLLSSNVANLTDLMKLCQELCDAHLLQMLELERTVCWRRRPRELAERLRALPEQRDPMIVYTTIESMSTTGIWIKSLKSRTGIPQANLTKVLKLLESRSLVKQVKSSKHPGRKVFMLAGLDPGEDITGGPWFTDGELDVTLVEAVAEIIRHFVRERSWREGPKVPTAIIQGLKNGDPNVVRANPHLRLLEISDSKHLRVPRVPGPDADFPTLADIHTNIEATGVVRKELTEDDVLQILDMMVYDGQIERHGPREQVGPAAATVPAEADEEEEVDTQEATSTQHNGTSSRKRAASTASNSPISSRKRKRTLAPSSKSEETRAVESDSSDSADGTSHHRRRQFSTSRRRTVTTYHYIPRPIITDIEALPPPYRAHLSAHGLGTGFSTAPCSRCPSFRLCESGGPVNAENCVYLDGWLHGSETVQVTNPGGSTTSTTAVAGTEGAIPGEEKAGRKKGKAMVVLGEGGRRIKVEEDPPGIPVGGAAVQ